MDVGWSVDSDMVAAVLDQVDEGDALRRVGVRVRDLGDDVWSLVVVDGRRGLAKGFEVFSAGLSGAVGQVGVSIDRSCSGVVDATVAVVVVGDEDIAAAFLAAARVGGGRRGGY